MTDDPGVLVGWAYPTPWILAAKFAAWVLVVGGNGVLYRDVRNGRALRGLGLYALCGLAAWLVLWPFFYVAPDTPLGEALRLVLEQVVVPNILPIWLAAGVVTLTVAILRNRAAGRR